MVWRLGRHRWISPTGPRDPWPVPMFVDSHVHVSPASCALITLDLAAAELPPRSATAPYIGEAALANGEGGRGRAGGYNRQQRTKRCGQHNHDNELSHRDVLSGCRDSRCFRDVSILSWLCQVNPRGYTHTGGTHQLDVHAYRRGAAPRPDDLVRRHSRSAADRDSSIPAVPRPDDLRRCHTLPEVMPRPAGRRRPGSWSGAGQRHTGMVHSKPRPSRAGK